MSSIDITSTKQSGHTFRWSDNKYRNRDRFTFECTRTYPKSLYNVIPITEVDSLLSNREIHSLQQIDPNRYRRPAFTLNKSELFNDFIEACEEFATEKTVTYDKKTGLDTYKYTVPIVDYLNLEKIPCREDISEQTPCPKPTARGKKPQQKSGNKRRSYKFYEMKKDEAEKAKYVVIDGNRYNSNYIHKSTASGYEQIVTHPKQKIELGDSKKLLRSKTSQSKTSITTSFPNDSTVCGIILHPEPMKFDVVHGDEEQHNGNRKQQLLNFINILVNSPHYVSKFKLEYRSTNTNGQWVEHGIFDGNSSIYDATKIDFDEIVAKEIRIIPITHTGSFDKVVIESITVADTKLNVPEETTVTYIMYLPHDKFRHNYTKEIEIINKQRFYCDCPSCMKTKGFEKKKRREFEEVCSDIIV